MKTKTNKTTSSVSNAHDGQTAADTKQRYEVILMFSQESRAKVIIEAADLAEAEDKASDIFADEIDDWNPINGDVRVESVEPVKARQSHE